MEKGFHAVIRGLRPGSAGWQRFQARSFAWRYQFDVRLVRADTNAGGEVVGFDFNQRGHHRLTGVDDVRAPGVKWAAGGWIDRRRDVALQNDALACSFYCGIRDWDCRNQRFCIRHQRLVIDRLRLRNFDELPEIHNRNSICDMTRLHRRSARIDRQSQTCFDC